MSEYYSKENLEEIAGGDADFMIVIAQTFLEEIPPDIKAMEEAVINNNRELAYQFAHKMKPNLEMFGLNLGKDITAIESWTRTLKSNTSVESNLNKITSTLDLVFQELKDDFNL
jgi:HPt (histidine-containing phosphotransfer) domain-containing protein